MGHRHNSEFQNWSFKLGAYIYTERQRYVCSVAINMDPIYCLEISYWIPIKWLWNGFQPQIDLRERYVHADADTRCKWTMPFQ